MKKLLVVIVLLVAVTARSQEVYLLPGSTQKIEQMVGDFDRERQTPTQNLTNTRFQIWGTDLGSSFQHKGKTYFLFGDIPGDIGFGTDRDPIAFSEDTNPEDGIELEFITKSPGLYQPITIPGISHGAFEVPVAGVSIEDVMYVFFTTESRCVLAKSKDDGQSFQLVDNDRSSKYFLNLSVTKVSRSEYPDLPGSFEKGIMVFGTGMYRQSNIYLYCQSEASIEDENSIYYFAGFNGLQPKWSDQETDAQPIINISCGGEISATYQSDLKKWMVLYNCDNPRGVNFRMANYPWGPFSSAAVLFDPWQDNGYCHFIHTDWNFSNCDSVQDTQRDYEWGGEYGPYLISEMSTHIDSLVTIYYTMSTWNPYTVVLMKSTFVNPDLVSSLVTPSGKKEIQVFPNPTSGVFTISASNLDGEVKSVRIYDYQGQQIMVQKKADQIDLSPFPKGVYFGQILFSTGNRSFFKLFKK